MKNKIKTFFKYSFLIIFLFGIISLIILQSTITIKDEKLTSISQEMIEPKIIVLSESQNGFYKDRYLIIYDNKDKSKIELFDLKTKETKPLPKSNLKGENQTLIGGETLYNINIVQTNPKDILGIEFFDLGSFTWKKLKTTPTIRKKDDNMPSFQINFLLAQKEQNINHFGNHLLIWGGINNKTNKQQNTLEIIDLKQDKLIMNTYFPFQGGIMICDTINPIIKKEFRSIYLVGADKIQKITDDFKIPFFELPVYLISEIKKPINLSFFQSNITSKHSSFGEEYFSNFLIDTTLNQAFILVKKINSKIEFFIEKIHLSKKYKSYKIINVFKMDDYLFLVIKKENKKALLYSKVPIIVHNGKFNGFKFVEYKKRNLNIENIAQYGKNQKIVYVIKNNNVIKIVKKGIN